MIGIRRRITQGSFGRQTMLTPQRIGVCGRAATLFAELRGRVSRSNRMSESVAPAGRSTMGTTIPGWATRASTAVAFRALETCTRRRHVDCLLGSRSYIPDIHVHSVSKPGDRPLLLAKGFFMIHFLSARHVRQTSRARRARQRLVAQASKQTPMEPSPADGDGQ